MESAVERYKRLLAEALARYFPRTTEYLRAEREAAQPQPRGRGKTKGKAKAPAKRAAKTKKDGEGPRPGARELRPQPVSTAPPRCPMNSSPWTCASEWPRPPPTA